MNQLEGKVISVNISEKKGTIKTPVHEISLTNQGVDGDAHAGDWHRQISLLGTESINKFAKMAFRDINFGEFAENISTEGLILYDFIPGDKLFIGETELKVTQIGKQCHGNTCAIFKEVGNCVMPKEGIFCEVIKPGVIRPGMVIKYVPFEYRVHVITLSDRASKGEYEDKSGKEIIERLKLFFAQLQWPVRINYSCIPDDEQKLNDLLKKDFDQKLDLVITTGGTGIGERDITVDAVKKFPIKEIPGIMEAIRIKYGMEKPNALLSRGVCGLVQKTFIYTLPGSVKAINEYLNEIFLTLEHLIYMKNGIDKH